MITTAANTVRDIWDSFFGRLAIIGVAAGWVPFYMLSSAHAALTS